MEQQLQQQPQAPPAEKEASGGSSRKKWDRGSDVRIAAQPKRPTEVAVAAAAGVPAEEPSSNSQSQQQDEDYSRLLSERARLLRKLKAKGVAAPDALAEKEKGFNIYLSGANEERVKAERKREIEKKHRSPAKSSSSSGSASGSASASSANPSAASPSTGGSRKQWKKDSPFIPGQQSQSSSASSSSLPPQQTPRDSASQNDVAPQFARDAVTPMPVDQDAAEGDDGEEQLPGVSENLFFTPNKGQSKWRKDRVTIRTAEGQEVVIAPVVAIGAPAEDQQDEQQQDEEKPQSKEGEASKDDDDDDDDDDGGDDEGSYVSDDFEEEEEFDDDFEDDEDDKEDDQDDEDEHQVPSKDNNDNNDDDANKRVEQVPRSMSTMSSRRYDAAAISTASSAIPSPIASPVHAQSLLSVPFPSASSSSSALSPDNAVLMQSKDVSALPSPPIDQEEQDDQDDQDDDDRYEGNALIHGDDDPDASVDFSIVDDSDEHGLINSSALSLPSHSATLNMFDPSSSASSSASLSPSRQGRFTLNKREIAFLRQSLQDIGMAGREDDGDDSQDLDHNSVVAERAPSAASATIALQTLLPPPSINYSQQQQQPSNRPQQSDIPLPKSLSPEKQAPIPLVPERSKAAEVQTSIAALSASSSSAAAAAAPASPEKPTLSVLTEKLRALDTRKQKYLLKILEKLEHADNVDMSLELFSAPTSVGVIQKERTVTLRLISTWGHERFIGLTEIEFLSADGHRIPIRDTAVQVRGVIGTGMSRDILRLFNGKTRTTVEGNMWSIQMPPIGCVDLVIKIPAAQATEWSKLRVWNYNKSPVDSNRGVREMEVLVDSSSVWKGTIARAPGTQVMVDFSTLIPISAPPAVQTAPVSSSSSSVEPHPPSGESSHHNPHNRSASRLLQSESAAPAPPVPAPPPSASVAAASPSPSLGPQSASPSLSFSKPVSVPSLSLSSKLGPSPSSGALSARSTPTPGDGNLILPPPAAAPAPAPVLDSSRRRRSLSESGAQQEGDNSSNSSVPMWLNETPRVARKAPDVFSDENPLAKKEAGKPPVAPSLGVSSSASSSSARQPIVPPLATSAASNNHNINNPIDSSLISDLSSGPMLSSARRTANSMLPSASSSSSSSSRIVSNPSMPSDNANSSSLLSKSGLLSGRRTMKQSPILSSSSSIDHPNIDASSLEMESTSAFLSARGATGEAASMFASSSSELELPSSVIRVKRDEENTWDSLNAFRKESSSSAKGSQQQQPISARRPASDLVAAPSSSSSSSSSSLAIGFAPLLSEEEKQRIMEEAFAPTKHELQQQYQQQQQQQQPAVVEPVSIFEIPNLPRGKFLTINILSTWGDPHYVGLSGLELFDDSGSLIQLSNVQKQLRADPADINILPEYSSDPRTIDKIVDGVNRTCDDMHVWLAPFTPGGNHFIYFEFDQLVTVSMIRFWNYNKSRIHSYRGVRYVEISLDGTSIFKGEIQKAPGTLENVDAFSEVVLFTMDDTILSNIEAYDAEHQPQDDDMMMASIPVSTPTERPRTAGGSRPDSALDWIPPSASDMRPMTGAVRRAADPSSVPLSKGLPPKSGAASARSHRPQDAILAGRRVKLAFVSSWGDPYYLGLTSIQLLGPDLLPIPLTSEMLTASPRDMNDIPGHSGDYRTLDKLVDGTNVTTSDRHMWLIPMTMVADPHLLIDLGRTMSIGGISLWNYNKNPDDASRGVKAVRIFVDDALVSPPDGFIVRKAPGESHYDFGHTIRLFKNPSQAEALLPYSLFNARVHDAVSKSVALMKTSHRTIGDQVRQDYETPLMPSAHVFKFMFTSTHGDPHYVGLNGLELYDALNNKIPIQVSNLEAVPKSVSMLPELRDDVRTLDKLVNGTNATWSDEHMWLAPFTPGQANLLFVMFAEPVAISLIKLWNYAKTPSRGVDELEVYADDSLIFKGYLRSAPSYSGVPIDFVQTVVFTNDATVIARERKNVYVRGLDQEVLLYNDNRLESGKKQVGQVGIGQMERPMTMATGSASRNTS